MTSSKTKKDGARYGRGRKTAAPAWRDGLIHFLLLTGLFLFVTRTYGLPAPQWTVLIACLTASGTALAIWSLRRHRLGLVLFLLMLLALGLLIWRNWEIFYDGAVLCGRAASEMMSETFPAFGDIIWPEMLSQGTGQTAAVCFLAGLIFLYAVALGWPVMCRRSSLLAAIMLLPWIVPAFLAELDISWGYAALITVAWVGLLLTGQEGSAALTGTGILTAAVLGAGALFMAALLYLFPAETYSRPAWTDSVRTQLMSLSARVIGQFADVEMEGGVVADTAPQGPAGTVDLSAAGPRAYTGEAALYVESDRTGAQYLRGAAYGVYTGTAWERIGGEAQMELAAALAGRPENLPLLLPAADRQTDQVHTTTIYHTDRPSRLIYFPYQPISVEWASLSYDSVLISPVNRRSYTIRWIQTPLEPAADAQTALAEEGYRQFVYQNYLDVPEDTAGFLLQWRQDVEAGIGVETGPVDTGSGQYADVLTEAERIRELLAATTEYDLQAPYMRPNGDFVTYFLGESRRGYCMHYASAAALLLRMEGIPARYVSGYLAQITDPESTPVPDSSAHAWVEVYLDGYGWYPVEMTPSVEVPMEQTEPEQEPQLPEEQPEPSPPDETPEQEPETPAPEEGEQAETDIGEAETNGTSPWLWIILAAIGLALSSVLFRTYRRRRLEALPGRTDYTRAAIDAYKWFQRLEPWGGTAGPEVMDAVRKACFSRQGLTQGEYDLVLTGLKSELSRLDGELPWWKRAVYRVFFPPVRTDG